MTEQHTPTSTPDVSVIIINWNTCTLLRNCLASLPMGTEKLALEIFVVDNGSHDGSQQMVKAEFPHVQLIENQNNRGFAAANNQALQLARGRYMFLLNSDTVVCEHAIDQLVELMQSDPTIGMAGAQLLNENGSRQHSIAPFPSLLTELAKKTLLRKINPEKYYGKQFQPDKPVDVQTLVGAAMMVSRDLTDRIGFYDDSYFFFLEETDWCLRAHRAGFRVVFCPQAGIYHLQGKTAAQVPVPVRIEYWRSRYRYFRQHHPIGTRLILGIGLMIELWIDVLWFALLSPVKTKARHRLRICLAIVRWHLLGRPAAMGLAKAQPDKEKTLH